MSHPPPWAPWTQVPRALQGWGPREPGWAARPLVSPGACRAGSARSWESQAPFGADSTHALRLHSTRLGSCAPEAVPASPVGLFAVSLRSAEAPLAGCRGSRTARGTAEPARGRGQRAGAGPEAGAPGLVEQQHHPVAQLCQVVLSRCFGAWSARGEALGCKPDSGRKALPTPPRD